ncbi:MAG: phage terminase large subunit [Gammaproteobacteria bacterium]|nr:phage terminase large subunit [Gammaproteobacteria bacterium]
MTNDLVTFENYAAFKSQNDFHQSTARYKLYGGAMGGGKSFALCWEAIRLSIMYPGNEGLISRFRGKDLRKTTLPILLQMIPQKILAKYNKTDGHVLFKNGSQIHCSDLEDPNKLKSMNLGFFAIDEATDNKTDDAFNMLTTRLRKSIKGIRYFGLLATNPEPGWVKDRFITSPENDFKYFPALPKDNPYLPATYVDDVRRALANRPALIARYLEGSWDAFDDMIFEPQWIIPGMPLSPHLYKLIFVDPAISEKTTSDETAITTIAFDEYFGIYYEIETVAGRWNFDTIKANIRAAITRHNPNQIHVENVQAQDWLVQDLQSEGLPVVGYRPDKDKIRKAMFVQDMFSRGIVRVNDPDTQRQLIDFPNATHDDRMDALISGLGILKGMNLQKKDPYIGEATNIRAITPDQVIKDQSYDLAKTYKNLFG